MSPQDAQFDWVKARAKCSLGTLFGALAIAVEQDVKSIKDLQRGINNFKHIFAFTRDRNVFTVTRENNGSNEPLSDVTFTLSTNEITVKMADSEMFIVVPALNANGDCKLTVGAKELEIWQVCQMALDGLFFGTPEISRNPIELW
jgi:hypothetical protein